MAAALAADLARVRREANAAEQALGARVAAAWPAHRAPIERAMGLALAALSRSGRDAGDGIPAAVAALPDVVASAVAGWVGEVLRLIEAARVRFARLGARHATVLIAAAGLGPALRPIGGGAVPPAAAGFAVGALGRLVAAVAGAVGGAIAAAARSGRAFVELPRLVDDAVVRFVGGTTSAGTMRAGWGQWVARDVARAAHARGMTAVYGASPAVGAWEWVAQDDERTCPECADRHGTRYPATVEFDPAHPHCRCLSTPVAA